jgi:tetraacyldisaccharide 4'-kinase
MHKRAVKQQAYVQKVPLIVVGGLRMGGSGKTPVTIALAKHFQKKGLRVAIMAYAIHKKPVGSIWRQLSPGNPETSPLYSEEAQLIQNKSGADVYVTRDRYALWEHISSQRGEKPYDLLLSDDGLQDPRLAPSYQILLKHPSENPKTRNLFPRGPFRFTAHKCKHVSLVLHGPYKEPHHTSPKLPQFYRDLTLPPPDTSTHWTLACALGNPQRLLDQLHQHGFAIQRKLLYPDHAFLPEKYLLKQLENGVITALLITEKDAVKAPILASKPQCFTIKESIYFHPSPDTFLPPLSSI